MRYTLMRLDKNEVLLCTLMKPDKNEVQPNEA